jgi:hypothetical protein
MQRSLFSVQYFTCFEVAEDAKLLIFLNITVEALLFSFVNKKLSLISYWSIS